MRGFAVVSGVGASLLLTTLATPCAAEGTAEEMARRKAAALGQYDRGIAAYDGGRFAEALLAFRSSLSTFPSPNSRLFVARCQARLDKPADAYNEYLLVEREAAEKAQSDAKYRATRDAARQEREALRSKVALLRFSLSGYARASVVVNGTTYPAVPALEVAVGEGPSAVRVEGADVVPEERNVTAVGGSTQEVAFVVREASHADLKPPPVHVAPAPEPRARPATWAFVSFGLAGAAAAGSVMLGVASANHYAALQDQCAATGCPESRTDAGRTLSTFTYVTAGAAIAFAAVGVVLFFTRGTEPGPRAAAWRTALAPGVAF